MFHIELRQFPNNVCRFNLGAEELSTLVLKGWTAGDWIEVGERKWSPHQAKLTVIEGPEVPPERLTMGRGWRHAQHEGRDVTAELLEGAHRAPNNPASAAVKADEDPGLLADSLGLHVLTEISREPVALSRAWRLAVERFPDRSPGECLQLAEQAVGELLDRDLIVLCSHPAEAREGSSARGDREASMTLAGRELGEVLGALESWTGDRDTPGIWIHSA